MFEPVAVEQLKCAIDGNDVDAVRALMTANPSLHGAPMGYGGDGPLTWVAECRVPREAPSNARLEMARWMIEHGSDVHQGGDGPLSRAALADERIAMMELLVSLGADVNARWRGRFPVIHSPCETLAPRALRWLLEHGADPNVEPESALDAAIGTYYRSAHLPVCIEILLEFGGRTRFDEPVVLDLLRGRMDRVKAQLEADPALVHRHFDTLDFGCTGARRLTLRGSTLLHVASEYGRVDAAALLLARGADVNARATVDPQGIGGQTPLFHAVSQFRDWGVPVAQLLLRHGADLQARATLPGHYEKPDEVVEATPLEYALRFPGGDQESGAVQLLRAVDSR